MNKLLSLLVVAILLGCTQLTSATDSSAPQVRCMPPPGNFKESDLIGTWVAEYAASIDTLILRENGTYRQIFDVPRVTPPFHYEGDGQRWWVEQRESGYLRLHLQGMHRCDDVASLCTREGGGVGDALAFDYCEDQGMNMPGGEVILIVTGVSEKYLSWTPLGIWLRHARLADPDAPAYHFQLTKQ